MNKYTTPGSKSVMAESYSEAAEIFAARKARQKYGRKGYARTCNANSHAADNSLVEYSAFIGYTTGPGETTGGNIHFTISRTKIGTDI